jgi:ribokinase
MTRPLSDLRFVVVGAYVVDCFVRTPRLPVWDDEYEVRSVRTSPGGKALNQAVALARLGAQVTAVGVVGDDGYGRGILDLLGREGVDVRWMDRRAGVSTAVCVCLVGDGGESSILWHIDDEASVRPETVRAAEDVMGRADAVLVTFEMPPESVRQAIQSGNEAGATVIVQPAPVLKDRAAAQTLPWDGVHILVPNEAEARLLLATPDADEVPAAELAQRLAVQTDVPTVIVTLGPDGCVVHSVGGSGLFAAQEVAVVDATGASDAFTATLAAHLTAGAAEAEAVDEAQRAAALAIQRSGGHESMPV